ncbi:Semaphorin-1A [Apis cerana cerana]|uniref:Semaphorin-1A n=1 Tax=Apis cerana cerana TaxID=94128 RepID=A0A2A3EB35_APICC|nr:Semaphorin-1A [Apis cerana cerana]
MKWKAPLADFVSAVAHPALTEGQLYAATVADFSGGEPLIHRDKIRTERSDLNQLNGPNFVSSFAYEDYVFFFYRETAVEYMNCGKAVYSRVGRVCQHDKGGPHAFNDRWTSFLKARLNCSVPGEYPFYFNEIRENGTDYISSEKVPTLIEKCQKTWNNTKEH